MKVVSWIDTKVWDETHDPQKSIGWCPMVLDSNATKTTGAKALDEIAVTPDRSQWNEPTAMRFGGDEGGGINSVVSARPVDATKDTRIEGFLYGLDADVHDGSMWFAKWGRSKRCCAFPSRFEPAGDMQNRILRTAAVADGKNYGAFNGRGLSVDSKGVVWVFYGSGQLGRFDRAKCKVLSGPSVARGQHCPEAGRSSIRPDQN